MNIYFGKNQLLLAGKAWEIKRQLIEFNSSHQLVRECIDKSTIKDASSKKQALFVYFVANYD